MKTIQKPLLLLICTLGIAFSSPASLAYESQAEKKREWTQQEWREWKHWKHEHRQWCEKHPRKCQERWEKHRAWCDAHPKKCEHEWKHQW